MYDAYTTLRHVFELLAANLIFFFPAAKRRKNFWARFFIGLIVICAVAVPLYFLVKYINTEFKESLSWRIGELLSGTTLNYYVYYIFTDIFLMSAYLYLCYDVSIDTLAFLSLAARTVDLIKGVILYLIEFNMFGLSVGNQNMTTLIIYGALRMVFVAAMYTGMYFLVSRKWKPGDNFQLIGKVPSIVLYTVMIFVIFITNTVITLLIYSVELSIKYVALVVEGLLGAFVLFLLVSVRLNNMQKVEKHIIYNMMQERGRQYLVSKENIEIMNRKYHDLKHQIAALKALSGNGDHSVKELEQSLSVYDSMIKTGNEILDTIITEKSLHCSQKDIQFNYNIDSKHMEFIDAVDLYVMLGNAIDNAIEAVENLADQAKKLINLSIENNGVMLMVQITNYYEGDVKFSGSLPRTTKDDKSFHGFGIKSIKVVAEKYKGTIKIDTRDDIFTLTIGLPIV